MAWNDRDYGRSRRPEPDDDNPPYSAEDHSSRFDDDDEDAEPEASDRDDSHDDDPEAPDESDRDDHDEPELIACPSCGKRIIEEAEQCHHCGHYVSEADKSRFSPWIYWVAGILVAGIVITWLIRL